jgi:hypothetical protein
MMEKKLAKIEDDLDENSKDAAVAIAKGLSGIAPGIGSTLAEMVGFTIPGQRVDRVVGFVRKLATKVENHEEMIQKMRTPEGADLVEEAMIQASRAFTDERREYIANLLKNSLTKDEIAHDQKKKLFNLLSQLTDSEIINLKFISLNIGKEDGHPFKEKHKDIVLPPEKDFLMNQEGVNKASFFYNSINTLDILGLVEKEGAKLSKRIPKVVTFMGNLLLEYIEVHDGTEEPHEG